MEANTIPVVVGHYREFSNESTSTHLIVIGGICVLVALAWLVLSATKNRRWQTLFSIIAFLFSLLFIGIGVFGPSQGSYDSYSDPEGDSSTVSADRIKDLLSEHYGATHVGKISSTNPYTDDVSINVDDLQSNKANLDNVTLQQGRFDHCSVLFGKHYHEDGKDLSNMSLTCESKKDHQTNQITIKPLQAKEDR